MHDSTSTDWPRARGSGRRTISRKVSRSSPLGSVRISAGAETRPRRTTSFRSITATLMQRACCPDDRGPRPRRHLWTAWTVVDEGPPGCRTSVLRVVPGLAVRGRWLDLAEQFGHLGLDVLVEALPETVGVLGELLDDLRSLAQVAVELVLEVDELDPGAVNGSGEVVGVGSGDGGEPGSGTLLFALRLEEIGVGRGQTHAPRVAGVESRRVGTAAEGALQDQARRGVLAEVAAGAPPPPPPPPGPLLLRGVGGRLAAEAAGPAGPARGGAPAGG